MPYVLTQILSQLPLLLLASFVGVTLFEPSVRSNGLVVFGLCLVLAPAISFASLYVYRRINTSFGVSLVTKSSSLRAVFFGVVLSTLTLGVLLLSFYFLGAISFAWPKVSLVQVTIGAGLAFLSAPIEEVIFRGVLQRKLTGRFGAPAAIVVSAFLFSLAHLSNPGSGVQSLILVAAFSSVLLGATYWITGSLLASVAAHFAWNFLMFGFVGGSVSGFASEGAIVMNQNIGDLLSGSIFGIEASVLCPVASLLSFVFLCKLLGQRHVPYVGEATSRPGSASAGSSL